MTDLLTIQEVCAKLKVKKNTVYNWLREDQTFPKQIQLGPRCVRWKAADLEAWIASK